MTNAIKMPEYTAKATTSRSCVNDGDTTIVLYIELKACKRFSKIYVYSQRSKTQDMFQRGVKHIWPTNHQRKNKNIISKCFILWHKMKDSRCLKLKF